MQTRSLSPRFGLGFYLAFLLPFLAACGQETAPTTPPVTAPVTATAETVPGLYAFTNVNVLPMDAERVLGNQTVVVRDGRIESVSRASAVPAGATTIDGAGRYLMPGLAELHGHVPGGDHPEYAENTLFLFISNGITLVRSMAGDPSHPILRERLAAGELEGPTLISASPWLGHHNAGSEAQTRETVRQYHEAGYDLLKVGSLSPPNYNHMADEANKVGIPFAGHIPGGVTLERAIAAGQSTIDHLDRYVEFLVAEDADVSGREPGFFGSGLIDLVDEDRIAAAVELTVESGIWNVPTLSLVEHLASEESAEDMAQWPEMRYIPQNVLEGWKNFKRNIQSEDHFQPEAAAQLVQLRHDLLKALHDGGANIALGSDAPQFFNVPGFSTHREMAMMVAAGLTPYEVLVTGTRKPADYLGTPDDFGQVAPGHRADLILLEANPFEDIAHVQRRAGVMVRGRWYPEAEIQERLQAIARD